MDSIETRLLNILDRDEQWQSQIYTQNIEHLSCEKSEEQFIQIESEVESEYEQIEYMYEQGILVKLIQLFDTWMLYLTLSIDLIIINQSQLL